MAEKQKKSPVRFIFIILIVLVLMGALQYKINLWKVSQKMAEIDNFISHPDGTASMIVAAMADLHDSVGGYWLTTAGLVAGLLSGYFLASSGKSGSRKQYIICAVLAAAGLILSIAGPLEAGNDDYAQWVILAGTVVIEIIPGFLLGIVTLTLSLWRMRKREK